MWNNQVNTVDNEKQETEVVKVKRIGKKRPTLRHRRAFALLTENIRGNAIMSKGNILRASGYSESVANKPSLVFDSQGFQAMLSTIDDAVILQRFMSILQEGEDKDSLRAGEVLLKLKDRFPQSKVKGLLYAEEISRLAEGDTQDE